MFAFLLKYFRKIKEDSVGTHWDHVRYRNRRGFPTECGGVARVGRYAGESLFLSTYPPLTYERHSCGSGSSSTTSKHIVGIFDENEFSVDACCSV